MSEKLRELRLEKGVTQKEVARALNISKSAYANYEQGVREPSYSVLINICKYFKVSADYLLGLEN